MTNRARSVGCSVLVLAGLAAEAFAQDPVPSDASPAAHSVRRALVVCGLPGDDDHRASYAGAVEAIAGALVARAGFAREDVWVRFGDVSRSDDGPALRASRGLSTRDGLTEDVEALRRVTLPDDALWVIVLGHAHFDGRRSHLNLPGPDLSDRDFAALFRGIAAKEQVFFVTTQASGFFLKPLAQPGRVAISATEADQEVNETLFPLALADMLAADAEVLDRDKDGTITLFEVYLATVADVMRRYIEDELIATEHAQLDDNGDGHGSEVQLRFLPPESGGQPEVEKPNEPKGKAEPTAPGERPTPTLGPKDDGFRASRVRLEPLAASLPAPTETQGAPR